MMGHPNLNYNGNRISPIQLMILMSVRKEKKYGYEIIKELRELFDDVWEPKTGVIYPSIKKLQDLGMLVSENIEDKEYYSMSDDGREWVMKTLPTLGAMASVGMRFMSALMEASEDLELEKGEITDIRSLPKEEKLRMFMETRDMMEKDLIRLNEMIERIAGGN